jgi:hypothetical protein
MIKCPVCDAEMHRVDLPKHNIYVCKTCEELVQVLPDGVLPLGSLLERSALGDDRVRAAISRPTVENVASFLDVLDNAVRGWKMELLSSTVELRSVVAQMENRLEFAIQSVSGLDLAIPQMEEVLAALREVRAMLASRRGVQHDALH